MNPTDACGLQYDGEAAGGLLGPEFRDPERPAGDQRRRLPAASGLDHRDPGDAGAWPPRCGPTRRPGPAALLADQLVHHGCPRNEYYEFKASAEKHSDQGCLMEQLGCGGTQAHADCNQRLWNGEGSCLRGGYACIRCTEPGFEEPGHAFETTPKVAGIPIGLPADMPKAWFIALAALSKSATPARVRENATADHQLRAPSVKRARNDIRRVVGPFNRVEGDLEVTLDIDDGGSPRPTSIRRCIAASSRSCRASCRPMRWCWCRASAASARWRSRPRPRWRWPMRPASRRRQWPPGGQPDPGGGKPGRPPDAFLPVLHARLRARGIQKSALVPRRVERFRATWAARPTRCCRRARASCRRWACSPANGRTRWRCSPAARRGRCKAPRYSACTASCASFAPSSKGVTFGRRWRSFAAIASRDQLDAWRAGGGGDLRAFLDIAADLDLWHVGRGTDRFMSYGCYQEEGGACFPRGCGRRARCALDVAASRGHQPCLVRRGRVAAASGRGQHAAGGGKGGRLFLVQGAAPGRAGGRNRRPGAPGGGRPSAGARHGRRAAAASPRASWRACWNWRWCCPPWSAGSTELAPGEPWCITPQLADETAGVGLIEAARGSLGHWLTVRRGRIHNYQIIAPTTWNFSPRDAARPAGRAGTGAGGPAGERRGPLPAAIHHVVRSFDPCMVCTVH
jgi:hypothetical protein